MSARGAAALSAARESAEMLSGRSAAGGALSESTAPAPERSESTEGRCSADRVSAADSEAVIPRAGAALRENKLPATQSDRKGMII